MEQVPKKMPQVPQLLLDQYKPQKCEIPMNPDLPAGCQSGWEPYVYRSEKMLDSGDTFDPCCKRSVDGDSDRRWRARVLRFSDTAQYLINKLSTDMEGINSLVNDVENKGKLETFFKNNKDIHESATEQLQEYFKVTAVVLRDLQHCTSVLTTIVDGDKRVATASIIPSGRTFDVMRAESVASGCGSLERLISIARAEYEPRFQSVLSILSTSINQPRPLDVKRTKPKGYGYANLWNNLVENFSIMSANISKVGIQTFAFYTLTVIPFLYTSAFTLLTVAPALLLAHDKITMFTRCLKLFCHFTQLPGLVVGLGIALSNKISLYFQNKNNETELNKKLAKGEITFFSVIEQMVAMNPLGAATIASLGAVQFTAKFGENAVASLGKTPQIGVLYQIMQGIIMFFMTIVSSSIWKTIGFACKTTVKLAAPVVEGTSSLVGGAATFFGGFSHLATQMYNAAGQTVGYAFEKTGNVADSLAQSIGTFMDSFSDDKDIRDKLLIDDAKIENALEAMNNGIFRIIGRSLDSLNDNLQPLLEPKNVEQIQEYLISAFAQYQTEVQFLLFLLPIIYGTWTWFQPKDENGGLSAYFSMSKETERAPTNYVNKFGRIIPRPPINFVFQQCLHGDEARIALCTKRAEEWSGQSISQLESSLEESSLESSLKSFIGQPPPYSGARSSSSRRSGSSRKRGSSRRLRKSVRRASLRRGSARRARRGSARRVSARR